MDYHKAMLRAKQAGLIHATYRVEDTSPCQVAEMAGWMEEEEATTEEITAIWRPSRKVVQAKCQGTNNNNNGSTMRNPQAPMTSTSYKVNRGAVSLMYANFTVNDACRALWDELVDLTDELGYPSLLVQDDTTDTAQQQDPEQEF